MSQTFLFLFGFLVTLVVAAGVGVLLWVSALDRRAAGLGRAVEPRMTSEPSRSRRPTPMPLHVRRSRLLGD